jgi:hypothetical protein
MNRLKHLLGKVLAKYPDLLDHSFHIEYASLSGAFATNAYIAPVKEVKIQINRSVARASDSVLKGLIASEVSHIVRDRRLTALGVLIDRVKCEFSTAHRERDELATDYITVERGLGVELLAFLEYDESLGEDADGERHEGLTLNDLRQMLVCELS